MFDTIFINKKFLPKVEELTRNEYNLISLQTKDFENLLENYFVGEDGSLELDKVEYEMIPNLELPKKGKWNPPFFEEIKSSERIKIPFTGIIRAATFFTSYTNPKDEIFLDIDFKFIDGIIQGVGVIKTLQITTADIVVERRRLAEEYRNKRDNDMKYRISKFCARKISIVLAYLNKLNNWLYSYQPK